jgi:hypothetical protein
MHFDKPNCIFLYGFAGSGKTTIARRYLAERPLTLLLEEDILIAEMGAWSGHEDNARQLAHALIEAMIPVHLKSGYDVILPILPTDSHHVSDLKDSAMRADASIHEIYLQNDKSTAVSRLMERGTWGENSPNRITEKDRPFITSLYDKMAQTLESIEFLPTISVKTNEIDNTYHLFLAALEQSKI